MTSYKLCAAFGVISTVVCSGKGLRVGTSWLNGIGAVEGGVTVFTRWAAVAVTGAAFCCGEEPVEEVNFAGDG
jgi:hypothetical protein